MIDFQNSIRQSNISFFFNHTNKQLVIIKYIYYIVGMLYKRGKQKLKATYGPWIRTLRYMLRIIIFTRFTMVLLLFFVYLVYTISTRRGGFDFKI